MIKSYQPRCSVVLRKRIERRNGVAKRVASANRLVDLTPYLIEGSTVTTSKSLLTDEPGSFSVSIPDQIATGSGAVSDSLYGLVEPMDYVEIRMARSPHEYVGQGLPNGLPIIMRGFVKKISRKKRMIGNRPVRTVEIDGMDYGRVPHLVSIFPRLDYATTNAYLSSFALDITHGISPLGMVASAWMNKIVNSILNPWLQQMIAVAGYNQPGGAGSIPILTPECTVNNSGVYPFGQQPFSGTIAELIRGWNDEPWNEFFIEDRDEGGPYLIYRPTPFVDVNGVSIQGVPIPKLKDSTGADLIIMDEDMVEADVSRSDDHVANAFWVLAPRTMLASQDLLNWTLLASIGDGSFLDRSDPNCDPALYGTRLMTDQSNHGAISDVVGRIPQDGTADVRSASADKVKNWAGQRRATLRAMNRDNAVLEDGLMLLKGNERLRIGNYVRERFGSIDTSYYITGVMHTFSPFRSYTSNITVERGNGFLVRTQIDGTSPMWKEGAQGAYE